MEGDLVMDLNFDLYMNDVVDQARNEMVEAGYEQLTSAEEVDKVLQQDGTTLVMVNSVMLVAVVLALILSSFAPMMG
jgi:hypothetical protein